MIEQFQHKAVTSFMLWFDNFLLKKGQAFSNKTAVFTHYNDDRLDDRYKAFGSPYKQWVNDSSIVGADIPSGVYINNQFSGRGSNLMLDFQNGRALISGVSSSATISGSFALKDFNIYFTNDDEDDLLIDRKYSSNPKVYSGPNTYIEPYDPVIPAIFISSNSMKNHPFAFGGEDTTKLSMKAVVIAENSYQLDGVLSIFADSNNEVIPSISYFQDPSNEYGDIKSGYYSYEALKASGINGPLFFIEDVDTSKLTDKARKSIESDLHIGFIDFEIAQQRMHSL
jgi:hypothetical protein